jgi:plasmid stability protein
VPTLFIRNVPEQIYAALKARAVQARRSPSAEALAILEQALGEKEPPESTSQRGALE